MEITISTPALLFPTISLLMLAFTNRFLALANLIRQLHATYKNEGNEILLGQIQNLRYRINLIRDMQAAGGTSLFFCVISMFSLLMNYPDLGKWFFAASLVLMAFALYLSVREIQISVGALDLQLEDIENMEKIEKGKK